MSETPEDLLRTWRACWSAPTHLAVVHGPDAGWVLPIPLEREHAGLRIGRGGCELEIADPALARVHLRLRRRRGLTQVRCATRGAGATVLRPGRRRRPWVRHVHRRWRRVEVGDELHLGGSVVVLRPSPAALGSTPDAGSPARTATGSGPPVRPRRWLALITVLPGLALTAILVGGAGSSTPWLRAALLGALGLSAVIGLVAGLRRGGSGVRAGAVASSREDAGSDVDPAAFAVAVAATGEPPGWGATEVAGTTGASIDAGTHGPRTRADVPTSGALVVGPRSGAVARWWQAQLTDRHTVLACASPAVAAAGPWSRVDTNGRCGVADVWVQAVALARRPRRPATRLRSLLPPLEAGAIASRWADASAAQGCAGLPVVLGHEQQGGALVLDLVRDGPHALVAGTTGSGKSELLAAWVLALAVAAPPSRLHLLLVDYKGGATFGAAARLPHTVGVLTDLDPAASERALATLRAELRRRERLVEAGGVRDVTELADPPARLVVVVDELRALVEDAPDRLADLVRLATQGRSLGVHLVLATQRPSGVVTAQLRANVNLRLCLRVLDAADSTDVVGVPDAARLPTAPGSVLVQRDGPPEPGRVAWLPGTDGTDVVEAVLAAADRLRRARRHDLLRTHRPWLPALPDRVGLDDLPRLALGESPGSLLVDLPHDQRRAVERWDGPVLVVAGEPRSGRTTALQAAVADRLRTGRTCHVVSRAGWDGGGTCVPVRDPRRVVRLLTLLAQGADPASCLVLDDLESVLDAVDTLTGPGGGTELLVALLRAGEVPVALATGAAHRWSGFATSTLVMRPRDLGAAAMLGVPRAMVSPGAPPGRAVLLGGTQPLLAQVVPPTADTAGRGARTAPVAQAPGTLRLLPLPTRISLTQAWALGPQVAGAVRLGCGGDDASAVDAVLTPGRPWLVCGASGTGRSTLLDVVAAQVPHRRLGSRSTPADLPSGHHLPPGTVLLVDDVELLDPAVEERVFALAARHAIVGATTVAALPQAFRGLPALVAAARTVVALGRTPPGQLVAARAHVDPRGGPGRGVLVTPSGARPLQVAHP